MIIDAIKDKKTNRTQFLNLISYLSLELGINEIENYRNLNESQNRKNDYILYLYVENIYKKKIELFNNSILLKMTYSDFLYNKIKKYKKSYQTLFQLYSDIENNNIFSTIQQEFYVYRIKREIEERSINNINDGSDISFQYQCNTLMQFISKIAEVYYNFWNLLLTSSQKEDLNKLDEYSNEIIQLKKEIENKFEAISSSRTTNKKITEYYVLYLREIIKDNEKADNIVSEKLEQFKNLNSNENSNNISAVYDIENLFPSSHFQFIIISLDKNSFGNILKISSDISGKIGYSSDELIGHNLDILMPTFLKEEHNKIIKNLVKEGLFYEEDQKTNRLCVFIKTKSKFLRPIPLDIKIINDEDRNPFIFAKLDQDLDMMLSKNTKEPYYIMTNRSLTIKYFTANCVKTLNINSKTMNDNQSIVFYIQELYYEVMKIMSESDEDINRKKVQYSILKDFYISENLEQRITWSKNNKIFLMNCREIKMNDKLMGFVFHLEEYKEYVSSILSISNNNRRESFDYSKLSLIGAKKNILVTEDLKNLPANYIPSNKKEIDFDYRNKEYIFKDKHNNNLNYQTINDYYTNEYLNPNKKSTIKESTSEESSSFSIKTNKKENEEEEESFFSESESEINENNEQLNKNITKQKSININKIDSFRKSVENFNKLMKENRDNIYKVKLSKITLFKYNFKTFTFFQDKNVYNTSKFDERMGEEFSLSYCEKSIKKKNPMNKLMKLTFSKLFILPEINRIKQKEIIRNTKEINQYISKKKFHNSIKLLLICLILFFSFMTYFYIYFFQNNLSVRTDIQKISRINRYLSNLRDNSNDIFFQSFNLAILNNPHYYNFDPPREHLKIKSKNILLTLYQENLLLTQDLEIYQDSLPDKIKNKIDNYYVDFVIILNNLEINTTKKKINNLFREFTFCVYNFATCNDENINLRNIDYNFILYNAKIFYSENFESYIDIFLDVFHEKKKFLLFYNYILTILFMLFGTFIFFLTYKLNGKVTKEKEKILQLFFQINVSCIKKSIIKCEKFMDKEKTWSSYSNAKAISEKEENEEYGSQENENLLHLDSKIIDIIKNKENKKKRNKSLYKNQIRSNKLIIQEKGTNKLIIVLLIQLIILFGILLSITLYLSKSYNSFYHYTFIYFLIQTHKAYYSKYTNYMRMFITYYQKRKTDPMAKFISTTLKSNLKYLFINNENYLLKIYDYIKGYNLPESSLHLFSTILKDDICIYFENYSLLYNVSCEGIGDGVLKKGLYNTLVYGIHSIYYIMKRMTNDMKFVEEKGYKYNEILYGTKEYLSLYPEDESEWEEYEKLNPFDCMNDNVTKDLTIITEVVFNNITNNLIDSVKKEIINGFEFVQNYLIWMCVIFGAFLYVPIISYIIPDILKKNSDINKKRKLLVIIPKDILAQILYHNDDI